MKILCLLKTTGYELHRTRWGSLPLFTKKHLQENHTVQQKAEKVLRDALHETDWNVTYVKDTTKHKFDCDDYDLVLTLGGDGTFLSAAQHCSSTSILGINSNPHTNPKKGSIGALTSVCIKDIRNVLQKIQQKQYNIETWPRLHAMINGKSLSQTAVNEIYIGPVEQDQTANFKITAGTKSEIVISSGIIIATKQGSSAWYRNAGGKPFSRNKMGFVVREPNLMRNPLFTQGTTSSAITIHVGDKNCFLSFDSRKEMRYKLKQGEYKVVIRQSLRKGVNVVLVV